MELFHSYQCKQVLCATVNFSGEGKSVLYNVLYTIEHIPNAYERNAMNQFFNGIRRTPGCPYQTLWLEADITK